MDLVEQPSSRSIPPETMVAMLLGIRLGLLLIQQLSRSPVSTPPETPPILSGSVTALWMADYGRYGASALSAREDRGVEFHSAVWAGRAEFR